MKKNLIQGAKTITLGTIAAMAVTITACNDDISMNDASADDAVRSSIDAFGCGYRVISTTPLDIYKVRIPVNSKDIKLSNSNALFSYRITEENGQYFIAPAFNGGSNQLENDVLTLNKADGSAKKCILVSLTPEGMSTRGLCATSALDSAVVSKMVKGFIPGTIAPDAQASLNTFNMAKIFDISSQADGSTFLDIQTKEHGDYFYEKAENHNEIAKSNSKTAGFNLEVPIKGINIGIGYESSSTTTNKTTRELETAMFGWKCRKASGSLNINYLARYFEKNREQFNITDEYIESTVDAIMATGSETNRAQVMKDVIDALALQFIMDETTVNVLNNPSDWSYKRYENNETDMRKLISQYGMYIGTGCQIGGLAQTTLTKKSGSSEMSIEEATTLNITATKNKEATKDEGKNADGAKNEGNEKRDILDLLNLIPNKTTAKTSFGDKYTYKEIETAMQMSYKTKSWGGNQVVDIEKWDVGEDCRKWEVISFAVQNNENAFAPADADDNSDFYPLWKLCLDPARREALRLLTVPDNDHKIKYFNYTEDAKKTLVIADVKLKAYNNINEAVPVYDYDSRPNEKKMHFYIPMRCNEYYGMNTSAGEVLDFAKWPILSPVEKIKNYITHHMTALVAYEYVYDDDVKNGGDYTGIIELGIGGKVSGNQVRSGDDTFEMTTGSFQIDRVGDHYLLVRYATDVSPMTERFKGVGFFYTGNKEHNGGDCYKVFASSLGTDWNCNHEDTKAEYKYFWVDNNFENKTTSDAKTFYGADSYSPFERNTYIDSAKKIYPCGTRLDVTRDVAAEIANIAAAKK